MPHPRNRYSFEGPTAENIEKQILTGPVTTFRDLVVHVPVNCVSTCAAASDPRTAATANIDRSDIGMEFVMRNTIEQQEVVEMMAGSRVKPQPARGVIAR